MKPRHGRFSFSIAMLLALVLPAPPIAPATIVVNETCTLVDAINAANNGDDSGGLCPPGGSGPDTLELSGNVSLTAVNHYDSSFDEPTGLPEVTTDITLEGGGFTIARAAGAPDFRILFVAASGALTLNDVTVRNGGGGVYFGGGITALGGPLVLTNSTVTANTATTPDGFGRGGGILTYVPTTLTNSTVSNNAAGWFAGGIWLLGDVLTMSGSTVSGNHAGYAIGGILLSTDAGESRLTNSTFSGNSTGDFVRSRGGALWIQSLAPTTLTNVTLSGNSNPDDEGVLYVTRGSATLSNSIVANSTTGINCSVRADGTLIDGGNNFDDDGSCPGAAPITPGVDFDTTLADNGGPTLIHALLEGSVAIDAVGQCPLEIDQRGYRRNDSSCDSGAFEFGAVACATCVAPDLLVGLLSDLRLAKSCREATCHDPGGLLPLDYLCSLATPEPGDGYYYLE